MSQARFNTGLATRQAVDVRVFPSRAKRSVKVQELEVKLADLQQDYAQLPNEIFAVRPLPGDFFTVEEKSDGVVLALGDICGKGLAAGMWTTHLVGLVGTHTAVSSEPEAIVAGVNQELCGMT